MSQKREYVHVEVNGKNHLCRVWYGSKEMLWYGGLMEMDEVPKLFYAVSKGGLLRKMEIEISEIYSR